MARLLLVDDEDKLLGALKGFLEGQGFEVWATPSGDVALQLAEQHHPHLVLLDLTLAGSHLSGLDVLTRLKASVPAPTVFVVSGYTEDAKKAEALTRGADRYIEKPLRLPEILEVIREATHTLPFA